MDDCSEEELDELMAEQVVDWFQSSEDGSGISRGSLLVASMSKVHPRHHYKTAWKTLDVWRQRVPPVQALTFLPEFAYALSSWLVLADQPICAAVVLLCYVGCFRASELLHLTFNNLFLGTQQMVVVLGVAKRGLEQKVVLSNPQVIAWVTRYVQWLMATDLSTSSYDKVFPISYGKLAYWIRKGMTALQIPGHWTSHGLRRGGASELFGRQMPLPEIAAFGRWLSERSMREYLRRGEVAAMRIRKDYPPVLFRRLAVFAKLGVTVWDAN